MQMGDNLNYARLYWSESLISYLNITGAESATWSHAVGLLGTPAKNKKSQAATETVPSIPGQVPCCWLLYSGRCASCPG